MGGKVHFCAAWCFLHNGCSLQLANSRLNLSSFEVKKVEMYVGATALVGLLGYTKTTFRAFWAFPVLAIYPLSIFAVWGLDSLGFK